MKIQVYDIDAQHDYSTPSGFEAVYNQFWKKLYNICFHHTGDGPLAEELVQDIFKSLWERRNALVIEGSIENYLSRSARLKVAEHYRNLAIREKNLRLALADYSPAENSTQQHVEYNLLHQQITELVDELPAHCRQVYQMSRNQGLTNREIATSLDIAEKTVENQIAKALNYLRKKLLRYTLS